ncbi:molecular chaperone [Oleoguttula sp. CCFEE 5521]
MPAAQNTASTLGLGVNSSTGPDSDVMSIAQGSSALGELRVPTRSSATLRRLQTRDVRLYPSFTSIGDDGSKRRVVDAFVAEGFERSSTDAALCSLAQSDEDCLRSIADSRARTLMEALKMCQRRSLTRPARPQAVPVTRVVRTGTPGQVQHSRANATAAAAANASTTPNAPSSTFYSLFPETFPRGPPPGSPFTFDVKKLRKEFLQLQSKAHPDLAASGNKNRAEAMSSHINEAYNTLRDPLRRAQHLLAVQGVDVEDESAKLEEGELLMEVMEAREAVEEVEDEEGLKAVREENDERIGKSIGVLEECFGRGDLGRAKEEAVRLRYWVNVEESIRGWEKGWGGGMNHH